MAAEGSVPGDALYPVKRVNERAQLMLTFTDSREAKLRTELLERRIVELEKVTARGREQFVAQLSREIESHSRRARTLAAAPVHKGRGCG